LLILFLAFTIVAIFNCEISVSTIDI